MLINELPKRFDAKKWCRTGRVLNVQAHPIEIAFSGEVGQVTEVLVTLNIECSEDEAGFLLIVGELSTEIALTCQRCLGALVHPIKQYIYVSPVASEAEAKRLPVELEPLWTENYEVEWLDWIKEEIQLAMPIAPKHTNDCTGKEADKALAEQKENPFQKALAHLVKKN